MTPERWRRVQEVFEHARQQTAGARAAVLERECGGDGELRTEVESLLAALEAPGVLDAPSALAEIDRLLAPLREWAASPAAAEPPPTAPTHPARLGPYEVAGELGRGGMGVVYQARDPRLAREVAVKVLHPHLAADDSMAARFLAEARAASGLDHPHVCTLYDLGRLADGRLYLAMAYYPGGSLADRLGAGPLPVGEALAIALQVADGLHRTHEAGLVHRDVKPANIAFSEGGDAKILDFGIAKLAGGARVGVDATQPGLVLGTPRYMAPEQLRGHAVDRRADVWALAAVLYEMLAGRPPFDGDDAETLRRQIVEEEPPPLAALRPEVPPAVAAAVARGLAKEPAQRPATAAAFAGLLAGRPLRSAGRGDGAGARPGSGSSAVLPPPRPLPAPATSFVGREQELRRLEDLLGRARLVTLTGPGGTGKTRLALEAARRLAAAGRDVRLVQLADLADARLVPSALASALGLEVGGARDALEAIASAVGDRPLLLVLDNLEHLAEAAPALADLLARCAGLSLVATSRGPLRLAAEHELPVPSLPLPYEPPPSHSGPLPVVPATGSGPAAAPPGPDEAALAAAPATHLFLDRARAAVAGLELGPEDRAAVVEICRRLDGLPLAIELAAARVRLFPPALLLAELRGSLDLPGAGPRDQPARHRTLRTAIAWSYDLLAPGHRRLFRHLGVFRGGFTLPLAAAVTGLAPGELAEGLDALLDQALLRRLPAAGGEARFALLETLRTFAVERLAETGEEQEVRRAHRAAFLVLAERAEPQLAAGEQLEWLDRLEREHDNLRAAFDAAPPPAALPELLRLAVALWRFWLTRGHLAEGRERFETLLAAARAEDGRLDLPPAQAVPALHGAATLSHNAGRNRRARELLTEALEVCCAAGDERWRLLILNNLAWVSAETSQLDEAEARSREALELARALGEVRAEAVARNNLGFVSCYRRQWDAARRHHETVVELRRRIGDLRGLGFGLVNLAWIAREAGDLDLSERRLAEAREVLEPLGDHIFLAWERTHRGALVLARGDAAGALEILDRAAARWRRTGNPSGLALVHHFRGVAQRELGNLEAARHCLEEAVRLWRVCGSTASEMESALELEALGGTAAAGGPEAGDPETGNPEAGDPETGGAASGGTASGGAQA